MNATEARVEHLEGLTVTHSESSSFLPPYFGRGSCVPGAY